MANSKISVQGTKQVYNATLFSLNGDDDAVDVNGYIQSITWDTGRLSELIVTINPDGDPVGSNSVVSSPSVRIAFAQSAFAKMYTFLEDRYSKGTLILKNYTVGQLNGQRLNVLITGLQLSGKSASTTASRPQNDATATFVATKATYINDADLSSFLNSNNLSL